MGQTSQIRLSQPRALTRTGLAADVATQTTTNLFTITGTVLMLTIFGRVVAAKQATAQTIRLGVVPTAGGVEAFFCAASATTTGDPIDSLYTITGEVTDALIVAQVGVGLAAVMCDAAGLIMTPQGFILVPGVLRMTTAAANDNSGLIDWTIIWQPLTVGSSVVTA